MTKTQKAGAKLRAIMANPVLWARYFLKITDKTGQLVPFEFNPQQLDRTALVLAPFFLDFTGFFEVVAPGCPTP